MKAPTFAEKLGIIPPVTSLLTKAESLGLNSAKLLEKLAVGRGCWHYQNAEDSPTPEISEEEFSNEELAISLLSPAHAYSPHTIRLGAAMLGATGNRIDLLVNLAEIECSTQPVRYIAEAGAKFEPGNPFWRQLLERLPTISSMRDGVMPHPTRFVSMTGMARGGMRPPPVWIRPVPELALTHG